MPPKRNTRSTNAAANHGHGTRASTKKPKTGNKAAAPKKVAKAPSEEEFKVTVDPVKL
jgi:hypothetical protein